MGVVANSFRVPLIGSNQTGVSSLHSETRERRLKGENARKVGMRMEVTEEGREEVGLGEIRIFKTANTNTNTCDIFCKNTNTNTYMP